jgi:hypothetical protein
MVVSPAPLDLRHAPPDFVGSSTTPSNPAIEAQQAPFDVAGRAISVVAAAALFEALRRIVGSLIWLWAEGVKKATPDACEEAL